MSSPPGEWSSPGVTGQPPPPCSNFTLTPVGERRAALFGGMVGPGAHSTSNDLLIVELTKHTVVSECVIVRVDPLILSCTCNLTHVLTAYS